MDYALIDNAPRKYKDAIDAIWASICISILVLILALLVPEWAPLVAKHQWAHVFIIIWTTFLQLKLLQRRKWARKVYVYLYIMGLAGMIPILTVALKNDSMLETISMVMQTIVQGYATFCLFDPKAKDYFR